MTNLNKDNNYDEIISNELPSFDEIDKMIDYSPLDRELKSLNHRKLILKRASIGLASVLLVVGGIVGGSYLHKKFVTPKIPFELGTYTYSSQVGEIEGLDFSQDSYIILTEEKLVGPGTFTINNEEDNWIVYGQFYECEFDDENIVLIDSSSKTYYYIIGHYSAAIYFNGIENVMILRVYNEDSSNVIEFE